MKGTKPTKILVGGNQTAAKRFIGPANSQMEILKNQMSFQNLSQGVRRVWLYDDVYVECIKCFNYQECKIWVRPVEREVKEEFAPVIILIISTPSEDRAFSWDLLNNRLLPSDWEDPKSSAVVAPLSFFKEQIEENKFESKFSTPIQLLHSGEWEKDSHGNDLEDDTGVDKLPYPLYSWPWGFSDLGSNPNVIVAFNPNSDTLNYDEYYARLIAEWLKGETTNDVFFSRYAFYLRIPAEAFYKIDDDNEWEPGDFVRFSTEKGSEFVTVLEKNSLGGFNSDGLMSSILGSITETWTAVAVERNDGFSNTIQLHIYGDTVGPVLDSSCGAWSQSPEPGLETNNVIQYRPWLADPPNMKIKYIALPDEYTDEHGSYFFQCMNGYSKEQWESVFIEKTGLSWPQWEGEDQDYIFRDILFYNPLFGVDFTDRFPQSARMKTYATTLYDAWGDGDWTEPGKVESSEGEILDYPDYEHNRHGHWTTIGVGKTYEEQPEDTTKQLAWVAFDASCFCADPENYETPAPRPEDPPKDYIPEENKLKTGIHIHYRMKDFLSGYEKAYFDLVNVEREAEGLDPLTQNHILQVAAERMANVLAGLNGELYNEDDPHMAPDGTHPIDRVEDAGYFFGTNRALHYCGENALLRSTTSPEDGVEAWMNSQVHKDNILSKYYTEAGMAFVAGESDIYGTFYVTCQVFGGKYWKVWPGFSPMDSTDLEAYINTFLTLDDIDINGEFLKVYTTQKIPE